MSADNWTQCPKCLQAYTKQREESQERIRQAYGKLPPEDYNVLILDTALAPPDDDTLREDYEIGIHKEEFFVSYSGSCNVCGFSFGYKYKQEVAVI